MTTRVLVRRTIFALLGLTAIASVAIAGLIAFPEPLYAWHVETGRLRLYSDRPFDPAHGKALLDDVERRLAAAPPALRDPDSVYRIFVTKSDWRRRLVFLWAGGAAGVNQHPYAGTVFLREADIARNRLLRADGTEAAPPRTLAYYAAHEIGHSLIGRRIGVIASWRLPRWLNEGMADYIGLGGEVDIDGLSRALRAGDPALDPDPKRSRSYARYRLLVANLLKNQGWSADALLKSGMSQEEAERRLVVEHSGT